MSMRLGRLWVRVGDGAKKILSLAYSYLNDFVKKILSLAVNISIPIAQASFRICIVYSLAYSYLYGYAKKILSLAVNKSTTL